jgi:alkanesulfonate monooxygenase
MSMRIIMAPTEYEAWQKASSILDAITEFQRGGGSIGRDKGEYSARAVAEAAAAIPDGPDRHLWTGLTVATKGRTHITALVGSPDQIADALLRYYDAGIGNFILTGFDRIADTIAIGEELIPRLRARTLPGRSELPCR